MRHDRTGEPIDDDDDVFAAVAEPEPSTPVAHECDNGFIDYDADPPLKRCPICKPHLAPEMLRLKAFGPERADDPLNTRRNLETS